MIILINDTTKEKTTITPREEALILYWMAWMDEDHDGSDDLYTQEEAEILAKKLFQSILPGLTNNIGDLYAHLYTSGLYDSYLR